MRADANGIGMEYELDGPQGAPVVMMSHSLGSSRVMWEPQLEALSARYRVLRYDTRGHGRSDAPAAAYSLGLLEEDAIALVETLEVAPVHWVGLSLGGMIGQGIALRRPELLRSLVLCDTSAHIPREAGPMWDERIASVERAGLAPQWETTAQRWFTPPFLAKRPAAVERIREQYLRTPPAGFIGCCHALKSLDYLERLRTLKLPALVIVGADDLGTPVAVAEAMHERIDGSELVVIPSAAHLSNVEQPERFNEALLRFLARRSLG
jgi:3-oxoadipate enol-lactonase